ncbi:DegT/DnrJ/EryC1/StrS family aminotransferase [Alphaproteobacteria bacterium]|nr:DegT/DnrJ/EryC1/StrS family aminotransferase [Alphaproteobacteria bacterium]
MENNLTKRLYGNENRYVQEVLSQEFRTSSGATMMKRLEKEFAERFNSKYAISFINGTATMHAALEAMGVGVGDEVIVPPLTMAATSFAVLQTGATPIFADVDRNTFQIDPRSIELKITNQTKAIITVALYGLSPDMEPICSLADKYGLYIIEDNAECFLGYYNGKIAGKSGHCASFSFQSSKHLSSGEGGMLITDDYELANKIRKIQSLGYAGVGASQSKITKNDIQDPGYDRHVTMGWNYRMPELCCAVALAQVENILPLVIRRQKVAEILESATKNFHDWFTPQYVPANCVNSYWTWVCKLDTSKVSWHHFRDTFVKNGGDGVYGAWKLTYLEPMFVDMSLLGRERFISDKNKASYKSGCCPIAELIQPQLLQFKTNYWNIDRAYEQADVLVKTLTTLSP